MLQTFFRILREGNEKVECSAALFLMGKAKTRSSAAWKRLLHRSDTFCWIDYFSVPQPSGTGIDSNVSADCRRAIDSIHIYVQRSHDFVILAPPVRHAQRGDYCDRSSWMERGWCRIEGLANRLAPPVRGNARLPLVVTSPEPSQCVWDTPTHLVLSPVGLGKFTDPSDRHRLEPVLRQLVDAHVAERTLAGDVMSWRRILALRSYLLRGLAASPEQLDSTWEAFRQRFDFTRADEGSRTGWTPLRYAVLATNTAVAGELIAEHGVDVNAVRAKRPDDQAFGSFGGESILMDAALTCWPESEAEPHPLLVLLLDTGADPLFRSATSGQTVLHIAAACGNILALRYLAGRFPALLVPPTVAIGFNHSLSFAAILFVDGANTLRALQALGAPLITTTEFLGLTEIHLAAYHGRRLALSLLLQQPTAKDHINSIALHNMCVTAAPRTKPCMNRSSLSHPCADHVEAPAAHFTGCFASPMAWAYETISLT